MNQPLHDSGFIASADVCIHYRRVAPPTGLASRMPMLIVHGLSYFSYDWIDVATALAQDREVVAIDLRGFGDSGWSPSRDYGLHTMSSDLIAVLDHFGWSSAALVGHSMGGRIALCTAAWHRDRVGALVCVDFAPDVAAEGRRKVAQRIGNQPDTFESIDAALKYHGHDNEPVGSPLYRRFEAFLRSTDNGLSLKRDLHYRDTFRETLLTGASKPVGVDLWGMVKDLSMPCLFLRGSTSDMFALETLGKVHEANPRAQTQEIVGSHDLIGDNPDGLTRAISAFLVKR